MISREELYELVWSKPIIKIAEEFWVSDSCVIGVCKNMNIPRPGRGYWSKFVVDKAPPPTPLPPDALADQQFWNRSKQPYPRPEQPRRHRRAPKKRIDIPKPGTHELIHGAREHFLNTWPLRLTFHLKPYKRILVDVTASRTGLDKALDFANDLFNAFESLGHKVVLENLHRIAIDVREDRDEPLSILYENMIIAPSRTTVVHVDEVAIGLAIMETSEETMVQKVNGEYIRYTGDTRTNRRKLDHRWLNREQFPTGRLRLVAYAPYRNVDWLKEWQETQDSTLDSSIESIVEEITKAAVGLIPKIKNAARKTEIERQKQRADEERRVKETRRQNRELLRQLDQNRIQQSVQDSCEELLNVIQDWSSAINTERFLEGVKTHAADLPEGERAQVMERLRLAREFIGTRDPLDIFLAWKTPNERYQPRNATSEDDASDGAG